jgi:hypothetical protein
MDCHLRRMVGAFAACVVLVLLVALAGIVLRPPAPLTTTERRLVGDWTQVELPGEEVLSDMTFSADRTFRSNDGQFVGSWWITHGQVHVKYSSSDWGEHWLNPAMLWNHARRHAVAWDIRFVGDHGRVELAKHGEPPFCALVESP